MLHGGGARVNALFSPSYKGLCVRQGGGTPCAGDFKKHAKEVLRQIDVLLRQQSLERSAVTTARIYLQNVKEDAAEMNRQ